MWPSEMGGNVRPNKPNQECVPFPRAKGKGTFWVKATDKAKAIKGCIRKAKSRASEMGKCVCWWGDLWLWVEGKGRKEGICSEEGIHIDSI
jgi:hypothetical protein